jgi:glyoxylase I family protein
MTTIATHLRELEERLLTAEGRASTATIDALLSDDFLEFGSSGIPFGKQDVIDALAEESADGHRYQRVTGDWKVRKLADDIALVTYRVTRNDLDEGSTVTSLRSSIWKRFGGDWRMVFHQGTRVPIG